MIVETVLIHQILSQYYTPCFRAKLSSSKTHCTICWNRLRLHRGVNWLFLRQFLSTKYSLDLPLPVFVQNYHQVQPTVMSVGVGSDLVKVSNCLLLLQFLIIDQIFDQSPTPVVNKYSHLEQPTVLSIQIGSGFKEVSISDCWDWLYHWILSRSPIYHQILAQYPTPYYHKILSAGRNHSSIHSNHLRV